MITSNSGESRSKNTGSNEGKEKGNYRNGEKREFKSGNREQGRGNSQAADRYKKDSKPGFKGSKDSRDNRDSRSSGNNQRRDSFRNGENSGANKPYKKKFNDKNYGNPYDKDEEDNVRPQKRQQSSKDSKAKEQQPDKIEIINRIEKEKKAMQKKQAERKNSRPSRLQNRPKRTNNIDWTREYENGSYDDDDLDMYL